MDIYIAKQENGTFKFWTFKGGRIAEINEKIALLSPKIRKAVKEMNKHGS